MNLTSALGYIAATLTTVAYVPQLWTMLRTRNAAGVSAGMFSVMTAGVLLWLMYGLVIGDRPLVIANSISFMFSLTILVLKLKGSRP